MHDIEILVGLEAVLLHQSAERRAVAPVIVLLQQERLLARDLEETDDVVADALVDLLPQIEMVRIERVIEVENPSLGSFERIDPAGIFDPAKAAGGAFIHSADSILPQFPARRLTATPNHLLAVGKPGA